MKWICSIYCVYSFSLAFLRFILSKLFVFICIYYIHTKSMSVISGNWFDWFSASFYKTTTRNFNYDGNIIFDFHGSYRKNTFSRTVFKYFIFSLLFFCCLILTFPSIVQKYQYIAAIKALFFASLMCREQKCNMFFLQ